MLEVAGLAFRYARASQSALSDVSLRAQRGSVLGLLGPNGAGKTTLLSHLAGLLPVQQGQITLDGKPLAQARARDPTRIAIAPQDYAFYPMLTVIENLACFAGAARLGGHRRQQRIDACLDFAQLQRFASTRAEQLSGGLKRRLNLAIALLPEPELMLFDEATVGVDPQSRAFVLDAIKTLARAGAAVIYASHYMEEIESIADRVVILDRGRVLREGALNELLSEGAHQLTVTADGIALPALRELLARYGTLEEGGEAIRLRVADGHSPAVVFEAIENSGATLRHAEFGRYNLEQLFMTLTHRSLRDL